MSHDPENYAKMSVPFDNGNQADEALKNFFDAVEKARNEFKITDAHVIVKISIKREGETGAAMSSAHFGHSLEAEGMCAWSLGYEGANRRNTIERLMHAGKSE